MATTSDAEIAYEPLNEYDIAGGRSTRSACSDNSQMRGQDRVADRAGSAKR